MLLVLDNVEDNLEVGGGAWREPALENAFRTLLQSAGRGRLLVTSRHPLPSCGDWLETLPLPPLSAAQTRKLLLRLEGLAGLASGEQAQLLRRIGGHPRLLEYLDALLRHGKARLPAAAERLRRQAREEGVDPERDYQDLDQALADGLRLGARDVLLDELLVLADKYDDRPLLLQAACSNLSLSLDGLTRALDVGEPAAARTAEILQGVRRLQDLSLLTPLSDGAWLVNRWTAEGLTARCDPESWHGHCRHAGDYRLWRMQNQSHDLEDGLEAVRNWLAAQAFDQAGRLALQIAEFLQGNRQLAMAAAFAGEVLTDLPAAEPSYALLGELESNACLALGLTGHALQRWEEILRILGKRADAEPDRADYAVDLVSSLWRMADIEPEYAAAHLTQALDILRGLRKEGRLNPMDSKKIAPLEQRLKALGG